MSKKLKIKLLPNGEVQMETLGIKGKKCLDYAKFIKDVVGGEEFPKLLKFGENKEYIRKVLKTVGYTSVKEDYVPARSLLEDARYFKHLKTVNVTPKNVASHLVIEKFIDQFGKDYRFEVAPHPVESLRDRTKDNVTEGTI